MKTLIFLTLMIISAEVYTQEFAPIGSLWHYTQNNQFPPEGWTYKTFESASDTLIGNILCKKMVEIERNFDDTLFSINQYMYSQNDSVFFFDNGSFHLLYDFGAEAGDTVILSYFQTFDGSPLKMIIDSTNVISINGINRKIQYITCGDNIMVEFGNEVIEGIGSTYFMFPVYDGMVDGPLRCYQDSVVGLYLSVYHPNYGWNFKDCGEIVTEISEIETGIDILIYPNPSSGRINIRNFDPPVEFSIIDIYGQLIKEGILISSGEILTDELSNGIYFIILVYKNYLSNKQLIKKSPFLVIN